jgi:pyruvate-ferredoxin/flavodoxin oxidoreductase
LTNSSSRQKVTIDGNEAAAYVAHKTNEVIAIYPITPSSNMGEWADQWSAEQKPNIWGTVPTVIEMQSEGGPRRSPWHQNAAFPPPLHGLQSLLLS